MPKLGVNIDHVATLREVRKAQSPDPLEAAGLCQSAGAHGITVHLREDRRHIQERDVRLVREKIALPLNLEMAASPALLEFALNVRPRMATLVPERREELTTEGGLDAASRIADITPIVKRLRAGGIEVSLFIEPDLRQVEAAVRIEASHIEFHTGVYARAHDEGREEDWKKELLRLKKMTELAIGKGLQVNMGHGLNYQNTQAVAAIEGVSEFNIGHAIVGRAVMVGFERAVAEMLELVR